ncbi:dihydroneopterin aldolase [uncultured Sneathiella sp.]|jgi:dihydroneopterin aldolase|uniref:dihydroneopterin aldolase n=1 Tax=uncultured Sneathiella sp. TaxID=879315 RepID=UPI0025941E78|nr:dihydroneopterin aldolase [uncultured Sneathiella sp.]
MNKPTTANVLHPGEMTRPTTTHKVFISDLMVDMLIGVYTHEKSTPQPVRFNIEMTVTDSATPLADNYKNVVCYETISNHITSMAKNEHVNLVETLAEKVAAICLNNERVKLVQVKVEKLNAIKNTSSVGVEIIRGKP